MIRGMIGFLEADGGYGIRAEMGALLEEVSPAEADLLLREARKKLEIRGVSTTRAAQRPVRSQIPVRVGFERDKVKPGFFACDTVGHRGGSARGQFRKTLTVMDMFSGWIEERALPNAANRWVFEAFSDIEGGLPFPLRGAHYDNGMEFINEPLLNWCLERHIEPARSRPYHKDDNCYAEQKNFDVVRKTVGYFRFDTPAEYAAPAEVYQFLCPLQLLVSVLQAGIEGQTGRWTIQESVRKSADDAVGAADGVAGYFRGKQGRVAVAGPVQSG
jgi:hypothetical protein